MIKRIVLISSSIIILLIIAIIVYSNRFAIKYRNINSLAQIERYEFLAKSQVQVESMVLRHAYDDGSWVVITESEMIDELLDYFSNLEISYSHFKDVRHMVGGGSMVTIFNIGEKSVTIDHTKKTDQIVISDGRYYHIFFDVVSQKTENPFEKLYQVLSDEL